MQQPGVRHWCWQQVVQNLPPPFVVSCCLHPKSIEHYFYAAEVKACIFTVTSKVKSSNMQSVSKMNVKPTNYMYSVFCWQTSLCRLFWWHATKAIRSAMYSSVYTADITSLTNFWVIALLHRLRATSLMNTYIQNAAISLLTAASDNINATCSIIKSPHSSVLYHFFPNTQDTNIQGWYKSWFFKQK